MAAIYPWPKPLPQFVRFECAHCHSTLEVPGSLLGVSGPCPFCRAMTSAPTVEEWVRANRSEQESAPEQTTHQLSETPIGGESSFEDIPEALVEQQVVQDTPPTPEEVENGMEEADELDTLEVDEPRPVSRAALVLGAGSVMLFASAVAAAAVVLRNTETLDPPQKDFLIPKNLTAHVLSQKDRMNDKKEAAIKQAIKTVRQFLKADDAAKLTPLLQSMRDPVPEFAPGMFAAVDPGSLAMSAVFRKPDTEQFVTTVEPSDGNGPVFVVEQRKDVGRIHAEALLQQVDETLSAFLENTASPPIVVYVQVRAFRGQHPLHELDAWPKLDVMPVFPSMNPRAFAACAQPGTPTAERIERRASESQWLKAVLELRWSRSPEGREFIEATSVLPNAWARF